MDCSHPPPPVAKSFVKMNGFPTLFSPKRRDEFSVTVADESRPSSLPFFGYPILVLTVGWIATLLKRP